MLENKAKFGGKTMIDVVKHVYKNYATFYGRAGRREFWLFQLYIVLLSATVGILTVILITFGAAGAIGFSATSGTASAATAVIFSGLLLGLQVVFLLWGVATIIPSLALHARRLHDVNLSAWWLLIALIPTIGTLALYIMALLASTPGVSRFENEGSGNRAPAQQSFNQPNTPPSSTDTW